jgi:hypothetical protein
MSDHAVPVRYRPALRYRVPLRTAVAAGWRWVAIPLGLVYLVLLATEFGATLRAGNLDADAVSAPVIGELFGQAGPHATTVLGTFGWYATLLFELATKWLPSHRYVWEVMPYAMALGSVVLIGWSVWRIAGRWAASIAAVLLICASPVTLLLLLSMTQHAPDWFCCALLGAFIVVIEQREHGIRSIRLVSIAVLVGVVVGVNAASDPLVLLGALIPFILAILASAALVWRREAVRSIQLAAVMLATLAVTWVLTRAVMSAWNVAPEAGLRLFKLADGTQIGRNFGLWLQSITTLANGNFYAREPSASAILAVACAALSLVAVASLPRLGWRELRQAADRWRRERIEPVLDGEPPVGGAQPGAPAPQRLAFVLFWCLSAIALSGVYLLSSHLIDVKSDRYLAGLLYAAAAIIPLYAAGNRWREAAVLLGTCVFALSGIASLLQRIPTHEPSPTTGVANAIASVAVAHDLKYGYAEYWDAAPITWATGLRVRVYPVSICDENQHLCPFDLHVISSWYTPRVGIRSFLIVDPAHPLIRAQPLTAPPHYLGRPSAIYHVERIAMYVYPYDIARRFETRYEQWRRHRS